MSVEALLFQTGYLTITGEDAQNGLAQYRLGYPNREVRQSLNERLLMAPAAGRLPAAGAENVAAQAAGGQRLRRPGGPCCGGSSPAFPTNGTLGTTSRTMKATTPAWSIRTLRRRAWTWLRRRAPAAAGPTMVVRFDGGVYVFRVQVGGEGSGGEGVGPNQGKGLRRQIPTLGPAGPSDWGGVQPTGPQHRRL